MDIGQIVRKARKAKGWTLEEMASRVDSDTGNLSRFERGQQGASQELLQRILSALEITIGASEGSGEPTNVSPALQPSRYYRYPVLSWVSAGMWGDALQPYEPGAEDQHELSDYMGKGRCFWLKVLGDSMTAPIGDSIPDGHLILVDTGMEARPGHLVIAKLEAEDKATFKRLVQDGGRLFLKPLNPAYPLIEINGNCRFIGVVVETKRKLV
ncbi:XRE family transcriptional regulator [Metapseudomonas otitidis]|uniref:LexA family protein n=1 Tax=Metapseudomonas otitidis TaxID=319939 RepID=UPI002541E752|nr:XRE family transcriptional regulator [Pseudomonas otitidis]WIF69725.1 XRE family transcriptional regulator [Pseudomonas otitidis]